MFTSIRPRLNFATAMAADEVRDNGVTTPADEQPEKGDSLLMFPSEGTSSDGIETPTLDAREFADRSRVVPSPRSITQVPVAIIDDRATREAIGKLGEYYDTLTKLQAIGDSIDARLVGTEESVHALRAGLDKQLAQTDEIVRRTEALVSDRTLQDLTARIEARLADVEQAFQRIERAVAGESLERQAAVEALRSHIGERLERTEEIVRRSENAIADRAVREVSACIDARVTGADEVVRRIEQVVASQRVADSSRLSEPARVPEVSRVLEPSRVTERSRIAEPSPWRLPPGSQRVMRSLAAAGALVGAAMLVLVMRVPIADEPRAVAPAGDREKIADDALVDAPAPLADVPAPIATPAAVAPAPVPAPPPAPSKPTAASRPAAQPAVRRATAPVRPDDEAAPAPRTFVGDLSISSTPSGARVSINGRAAGVTPLVLNERPAGSVAIQISSDGFERWSASVQVRAGQMTNVAATLRRSGP